MRLFKNAKPITIALVLAVILIAGALTIWHSYGFRDKLSSYVHLLRGAAYFKDEENGRAEREFRKAILLDPQMMRSHYYMGLVYLKDGQFREASLEFRKEMALHPEFDPAYSSLAITYYKMGKRDGLETLWKKAIELNPDNLEAYKNLAMYCYNRGDIAGARRCVRQLEDRGVAVPAEFFNALNTSKEK